MIFTVVTKGEYMIKKLTTPEDISILFSLDDNPREQLPCDKDAWIQWLTEQVSNIRVGIWANLINNSEVTAYIVVLNSVLPPISDTATVIYLWSTGHKTTKALVDYVKPWVIATGAARGAITVPIKHTDKYMACFDTAKVASVYEWRIS